MAAPHPVLGASSGGELSFHSNTLLCSITVMYLLAIRANVQHFVPARGNPIAQKKGFRRGPWMNHPGCSATLLHGVP